MMLAARALVAFAVAWAATWVAARAARRIGLVDRPGPRKPHPVPTPLAGGVGVAVAVTVGLLGAGASPSLIAGMWALVVLGLVDDARDVRARIRLAAQAAAVLPLAVTAAPSLGIPRPLEVALAELWILGVISAINCFDCADGVAAGSAAAAAIALGLVGGWADSAGPLAAAVAGAAAGFLVLNAPPARAFLGEAGSTVLGFLLAALVLGIGRAAPPERSMAAGVAAAIVLAVPALDFALVHVRRARRGMHRISDLMASSGTDHLPHRLRAAGLSPRGVAAACAAAVALSGAASALALGAGPAALALTATGVGVAFLAGEALLLSRRGPAPAARPAVRLVDVRDPALPPGRRRSRREITLPVGRRVIALGPAPADGEALAVHDRKGRRDG